MVGARTGQIDCTQQAVSDALLPDGAVCSRRRPNGSWRLGRLVVVHVTGNTRIAERLDRGAKRLGAWTAAGVVLREPTERAHGEGNPDDRSGRADNRVEELEGHTLRGCCANDTSGHDEASRERVPSGCETSESQPDENQGDRDRTYSHLVLTCPVQSSVGDQVAPKRTSRAHPGPAQARLRLSRESDLPAWSCRVAERTQAQLDQQAPVRNPAVGVARQRRSFGGRSRASRSSNQTCTLATTTATSTSTPTKTKSVGTISSQSPSSSPSWRRPRREHEARQTERQCRNDRPMRHEPPDDGGADEEHREVRTALSHVLVVPVRVARRARHRDNPDACAAESGHRRHDCTSARRTRSMPPPSRYLGPRA